MWGVGFHIVTCHSGVYDNLIYLKTNKYVQYVINYPKVDFTVKLKHRIHSYNLVQFGSSRNPTMHCNCGCWSYAGRVNAHWMHGKIHSFANYVETILQMLFHHMLVRYFLFLIDQFLKSPIALRNRNSANPNLQFHIRQVHDKAN